jgi:peptide deformylase
MKLRLMNDPALREVCPPVLEGELDYIKSLIPEMSKILEQEDGAALAANQVGIIKRFFLMKDGRLIINPEIIEIGPLRPFEEGCLSIPGTFGPTQRAQTIKVRYKDETFTDVETEYKGIEAVAIQHEIDHLDGKLYIDQIPPMRRMLVLDKHRKFLKSRGRYK